METGIDGLRWYPLDCLGCGKQPVFRGDWQTNNGVLPVAIKIIRHDNHTDEDVLLNRLFHRNIVQCYTRFPAPYLIRERIAKAYDIILFEHIEGERLFDYLLRQHPISEIEKLIRQLIDVVNYLHSLSIVHYDIHPFNILISRKYGLRLKLLDFGAALDFRDPQTRIDNPKLSFVIEKQVDLIQVGQIIKVLSNCADYSNDESVGNEGRIAAKL